MRSDKEKDRIKLLITGGHLTPAIAVIERLRKSARWDITFMARQYGHEESRSPASELREIPKLGVPTIAIPAGKIPRLASLKSLSPLVRIPLGFFHAFFHILLLKPDVILSFGGYVSVPAALAGWILGIPIVTHEQTMGKGLANTLVELLAEEIAISWEDTRQHFRKKVVLTGNPIREAILKGTKKPVPMKLKGAPLLYVTGGNLGSKKLNGVIRSGLKAFTENYRIIHQCGFRTGEDDYQSLDLARNELPGERKHRYLVREWLEAEEIAWILMHADLVISRAGANIVTELAYTGNTTLFVPLRIAGGNEQLENAKLLTSAGTAEIIEEKDLTPGRLLAKVAQMLEQSEVYRKHAPDARRIVRTDAAKRIEEILETVYEKKNAKS